jgi:hypothetical protein
MNELTPARRAKGIVIVSLVLWTAWVFFGPKKHPFGDLSNGNYTDHLSNMNCARVFPRVGIDLWRKPVSEMFPELTPEERARLPDDVWAGASETGGIYKVPGWPEKKPLATSWSHQPRLYPPGEILLFAPISLIYHYTPLPAWWANRCALFICVLAAHAAFYLLLAAYLTGGNGCQAPSLIALFIVYSISINWSLQGFYDMAAVVPLLLCGKYTLESRRVDALLAYSASVAIHYRAFIFAPISLWAIFGILRNREWINWNRAEWFKIAVALGLTAASLSTFVIVWPVISRGPINNPVNLWAASGQNSLLSVNVVVFAAAMLAFAWRRDFFDCVILMAFALYLVSVRDVRPWHILVPLAWVGLPVLVPGGSEPRYFAFVRDVRLVVLLLASTTVFENPLLTWLRDAF